MKTEIAIIGGGPAGLAAAVAAREAGRNMREDILRRLRSIKFHICFIPSLLILRRIRLLL